MADLAQYRSAWDDAVATVQHRRQADTLVKRQMRDAAERYNSDIVFPIPDVDGEPTYPAIAGQIIADAIDSYARRANDTLPTITAPAVDPTAESHRRRADLRRHAWASTWHRSKLDLKMAKGYRQQFGYGTHCFVVSVDHAERRPLIETRNPLLTYPEPMGTDEVRTPRNIGFVYGRSPAWLRKKYPEAAGLIDRHTSSDDDMWDVLEWIDGEDTMVGILGKRSHESYSMSYDGQTRFPQWGADPTDQAFLLRRYPTRAGGLVPAICPAAVTLDRLVSAISRIVPVTDLMNKVAALNFISAEKSVFPHLVVLGDNGQTPTIVGGQFKDGRTGDANLVTNARAINALSLGPSPQAQVLMSDLERTARMSSSTPSMLSGELHGSLRSGQTVNQLAGVSIDPALKEAHMVMAYALGELNQVVAEVEKGYWPRRSFTVFSGWPGSNRHITYRPAAIWDETTECMVAYPMPGLDAQGATVVLGQLNSMRAISRRTVRDLHPMVPDGTEQETELVAEALDDAIAMSALGLVQSGQLAWTDLAVIRGKVRTGMPIEKAIAEAQEEAQRRQATQPEAPAEPDLAAPPEAMPGLNAPTAGGQTAPPAQPSSPMGQGQQFDALMQALMSQPGAGAPAGAGAGAP